MEEAVDARDSILRGLHRSLDTEFVERDSTSVKNKISRTVSTSANVGSSSSGVNNLLSEFNDADEYQIEKDPNDDYILNPENQVYENVVSDEEVDEKTANVGSSSSGVNNLLSEFNDADEYQIEKDPSDDYILNLENQVYENVVSDEEVDEEAAHRGEYLSDIEADKEPQLPGSPVTNAELVVKILSGVGQWRSNCQSQAPSQNLYGGYSAPQSSAARVNPNLVTTLFLALVKLIIVLYPFESLTSIPVKPLYFTKMYLCHALSDGKGCSWQFQDDVYSPTDESHGTIESSLSCIFSKV
ncbi:hypothetical protein POM88_033743 [Heracleum sosnowskyi]|uniref:Uncharacterized protein n=1 Tax=Heracleum sosnowskyi TaxID=360622 RepID=A0AAD8MBD3_9APIA|nr:hypothetical protein POM88_033743 [Heracleum sosnowskyi]